MDRDTDHWQARLPQPLQAEVVWPVRVEVVHDDSVPVSKWRGYDALGLLCWVRHRYTQWTGDLDAGAGDMAATPPVMLLREDEFEAWRSLLGTWVRRVQRQDLATGQVSDSGFEVVPVRSIPRL